MLLTCNKSYIQYSHTYMHTDIDWDIDYVVSNWQPSKPKALDKTRLNTSILHSAKLLEKRDWMR